MANDLSDEIVPVEVVTVVVSATPGPTQTPLVITRLQTVVVTATPSGEEVLPDPMVTAPPRLLTGVVVTQTPQLEPRFKYDAPTLQSPTDEAVFSQDEPMLRWERVPLAEDEYYEVMIERLWQGEPYYLGSEWLKEPHLEVPDFVRGTSDSEQYTWWVTIKRQTGTNVAGGRVGEPISPPSEQRTFTWSKE
ncbi:MAG: hypothetical protein M3220_03245 [Chloroflexota bacterium]|nr:hypothetical protein [Chloroflexota bacterium]